MLGSMVFLTASFVLGLFFYWLKTETDELCGRLAFFRSNELSFITGAMFPAFSCCRSAV